MSLPHNQSTGASVTQLGRLFSSGTAAGIPDRELLDRFIEGRDEGAFAAIMTRHGPMVLGVCRRLLRDPNDVDDAFQATFVILVRKARSLKRRDLMANWLYGVACRVSARARSLAARRARQLRALGDQARPPSTGEPAETPGVQVEGDEIERHLHAEVNRLPARYRTPIVLCYFEGLTHDQAAASLGWPLGTVKGRLARARELLSRRLQARGLGLSVMTLSCRLTLAPAPLAIPKTLESATLAAAKSVTAGSLFASSTTMLSQSVHSLSQGVLQTMFWTKIKLVTLSLLLAGGASAVAVAEYRQKARQTDQKNPVPAGEIRSGEPRAFYAKMLQTQESQTTNKNTSAQDTAPQSTASKDAKAKSSDRGAAQSKTTANAMANQLKAMATHMKAMGTHTQPNQRRSRMSQMGGGMMAGMMAGPGMGGMGGTGGTGGMGINETRERIRLSQLRSQVERNNLFLERNDENPLDQAIWKKLQEPLTMSFPNETKLEDVIMYIRQATGTNKEPGLPIYVDPRGLKEVERNLKSTISLDLDGIPLKTTLRLLLKQLDMAYCVRDGVLIISSVEEIAEESQQARMAIEEEEVGDDEDEENQSQLQGGTTGQSMMWGMS